MVLIAPLVGAAVFLSGLTAALPTNSYDSSSSSNSYGGSSNSNSNYGSSNSNSNYGSSNSNYGSSDSSNSYGGSSDSGSNYGNSGSNYGNSNNYDTSSSTTMMMDSTSTTMMMDSTSTTMDTTTVESTSTTSAYNSYQTSNYGSGSSYWGGNGYQDCVNQCIAQFGGSSGGGSYQATQTSDSYGSKGTGATHTIIVAPTKGLFRMVPFAVNASVGDTLEFHWGADQHTVTKSSALLPCNKSSADPVFASGEQNTGFIFNQVVNDTNPTFYYCSTATHCEKGMFGIINPQMTSPGSPTSLGGMMSSMAANDSDLSAYAAYSSNVTASNDAAAQWGSAFDMANMPDWSHSLMATNVLFTRAVLGMNSEVLQANGATDLSSVATTPLMLPMDISGALDAAASAPTTSDSPTTSNSPVAAAAGAAQTAAASPSTSAAPNGASSVASPRILAAAVVVLATIFAL